MRRTLFVAGPVVYAVAVYLALGAAQSRGEEIEILALVVALSVAAGVVAWRFAARLESARTLAVRGGEELALVGQLSATLSGPLTPAEVATQCLAGIRSLLPPTVVATLLQYEESAELVRVLAQQGAAAALQQGVVYAVGDFPPAMRTRLSQRIYSNLDPDAVVASALEELGMELNVSRVVISSAGETDLAVLHEWHAPGVEPIAVGTHGQLPLSALAAREGRTIAVRDARTDARLADPALGSHALIENGTLAAVATPIGLGGQLSGVLVLDQVGEPRAWTSQEIRLLASVAREP